MRVAWITDPHLDFVEEAHVRAFCAGVNDMAPDAVVVTGDVANASTVEMALGILRDVLTAPVYFVLGNHDYYGSSVAEVRETVRRQVATTTNLTYLSTAGVCELSADTCLVGHDGWADGRFGNWWRSTLELNDYLLIRDLRPRYTRLETMRRLAEEAAAHFRAVLPVALETHTDVIVATHVPPFKEACLTEGAPSDDDGLPHFSSRVVGEALVEAALAFPHRRLIVLCGHTHSAAEVAVLPNLTVFAGGVTYGAPAVQPELELP